MSKMSEAVLGSRWAMMCCISDGVVGESSNCGGKGCRGGSVGLSVVVSGVCLSVGICCIVFFPTVIKWSFRELAMDVSFVNVLFSYSK